MEEYFAMSDNPVNEMTNTTEDIYSKSKPIRKRTSQGDRNFICGCSKSYLSYPALYTHVKNKHSGTFPIGSNAKRRISNPSDENLMLMVPASVEVFQHEFKELIEQIYNASSAEPKKLILESIKVLFENQTLKTDSNLMNLRNEIKVMIYVHENIEELEKIKESMTIYQTLALYLVTIFPYCSDKFYKEYIVLIIMLCHTINTKGNLFLNPECAPKKTTTEGGDVAVCSKVKSKMIPEVMNLFIAEMFPVLYSAYVTQGMTFEFLGKEEENIKNLILMTKYLCNWLFYNEFVDFRLELNSDL